MRCGNDINMSQYKIGQLAREAGVATSTVRYYERRGLLRPQTRSHGNYRVYGDAQLQRLLFVRSAQAVGFTLTDIATLLRFRDGEVAPCQEVQAIITSRLDQVIEQTNNLQHMQGMLQKWLVICKEAECSGRCGVLEGLSAAK